MKLYTMPEVAEILKVHVNTVRRLLKASKLEAVKVGNQYRISEEQLNAYLNKHTVKGKNGDAVDP